MYSRSRIRTGLIIAIAVSVATVVTIFLLTMDRSTWSAITKISPFFLCLAFILALARWLIACVRTQLLVRSTGSDLKFSRTVKAVLGGGFAGAVTPYHAAGIPTEIYFFIKYGLGGGEATAIVTTGAAISILLFTLMMPFVLLVSASKINVGFGIKTLLVSAGIIAIFFFLLVAYSMKEPEKLARTLRRIAPKCLKKRKGFHHAIDRFVRGIDDFSKSLRLILDAKKSVLVSVVLLTLIFWASGFLVSPVILWGLGYPELFWKALLAQLVVSCLMPFVPVPGESGMAEATFAGVFAIFVPKRLVGFVTLSWRFFMFYITIAVLGVFFIIAARDAGEINRKNEACDEAEDVTIADSQGEFN